MTTFGPSTLPLDGVARVVLIGRVKNAFWNLVRSIRNRREIERLGAMSDAELADIGLRRTDLHVALRSPFGIDPTASLRPMAAARDTLCGEDAARRVC
ncbi:MAG: DUF1127 domain-containing protein [Rhizobiaceae bacterium]|jgi:uncharacterized protein YjiS (DUF1127 family)|nr:MAG: DUF1127 domain-containing protein [Rhizobiaceae bacterium]